MKTYIGWFFSILAVLAVLVLVWPHEAGSEAERRALAEGRVIITYWDRHFGHEHDARLPLIDEFNNSQDRIYVRAVPVGWRLEKMLTAIASGAPPDICSVEGTALSSLASQGCFTALDDRMNKHPHLREEAFFPHAWKAVTFPGPDGTAHTWGIPTTTDTYCLIWNKAAFRRAGLDPERPPRTLSELEEYARRLTIRGPTGIEQIGYLPWLPWDQTVAWGGLFGGQWYDEEADRIVCAEDPRIVASLAWQQGFTIPPRTNPAGYPPHALDATMVAAFGSSVGEYQSANNPFYSGKVAMIMEGEWQATFIPKYAPDLDWGVAPLPVPDGTEPITYAPTTVLDAIPADSRHPEEAWAFLEWFHTPRPGGGPSPASDYCHAIHNIPTRPDEALQERFTGNPKFKVFVDQLFDNKTFSLPVMPALQFLLDEADRQRNYLVLHEQKRTPEEAARIIQHKTNAELQRIRRILERVGRP